MGYARWLFLGPALIHVWWGMCVIASPEPLLTTGIADVYLWCQADQFTTGALLLAVGVSSIGSLSIHDRSQRLAFAMLIPQQFVMLISATTALNCIHKSQFADGLPYDWLFIAADQCYVFVIGVCHTCLIVEVYIWEGVRDWWNTESSQYS